MNRNSGKKFEEIFDAFVVAKTAKGVSDIPMPFDDLTKEHLDQMVVSMRQAGFAPGRCPLQINLLFYYR